MLYVCVYTCVCAHTYSLPHHQQTLDVSASTLYESELQYSVGGAGVGYPAGGSSTSMHTHTHIYVCAVIFGKALSWWRFAKIRFQVLSIATKKQHWININRDGEAHASTLYTDIVETDSEICVPLIHSSARTYSAQTHKHSMLSHPARCSTAWPIISCLQSKPSRDEMS